MSALPDSKSKTGDSVDGPQLIYDITDLNPGIYYLWIRMAAPDGGEFNSCRFRWNTNNIWWRRTFYLPHWRMEIGALYQLMLCQKSNYTQLNIWMREDGVMIDSLILTSVEDFDPYISENLEHQSIALVVISHFLPI